MGLKTRNPSHKRRVFCTVMESAGCVPQVLLCSEETETWWFGGHCSLRPRKRTKKADCCLSSACWSACLGPGASSPESSWFSGIMWSRCSSSLPLQMATLALQLIEATHFFSTHRGKRLIYAFPPPPPTQGQLNLMELKGVGRGSWWGPSGPAPV